MNDWAGGRTVFKVVTATNGYVNVVTRVYRLASEDDAAFATRVAAEQKVAEHRARQLS